MRSRGLMLAGWLAATTISGLLAWSAVSVAGDAITPRPVEPLTASEMAQLPTSAATTPPTTTTSAPLADPIPSSTLPSTTSATPATTEPDDDPSPTTSPTTTTSTTVPSSSPETVAFPLEGGTVGVTFDGSRVNLAWSTANPGYHAETKDAGPEKVVVEFEGAAGSQKIVIEVEDGRLRHTIENESEDD